MKEKTSVAKTLYDMIGSDGLTLEQLLRDNPVTYSIEKDLIDNLYYINYTVSTFHVLIDNLELDDLCDEFNAMEVFGYDSDICQLNLKAGAWIGGRFDIEKEDNTYNYEMPLSNDIQYALLKSKEDGSRYILLSIHQGGDIRANYSDTKLFKLRGEDFLSITVHGTVDGIEVSNELDGYNLLDEEGNPARVKKDSNVNLHI